jgi:hypothetical protein
MKTGLFEKPRCGCANTGSCALCCACRACLTTPRCIAFSAAAGRYHRECVGRIGAPTAPRFASRSTTSGGGGGWHRTVAAWCQHLLPPPHRAARRETLSTVSEVAGSRRRRPANYPGAAGQTRPAPRRCPAWWMRPAASCPCPSAWCWRMPSSTPTRIADTFARCWEPTA